MAISVGEASPSTPSNRGGAEEVPPPLKEQLANGGRLVLPIGPPGGTQTLWRITKQNNNFVRENKGIVRFVPFTRRK